MNSLPKPDTAALKTRFREAVVARKKADYGSVQSRGKEILGFIRKQAKADLESLEAVFLTENDVTPVIARIEARDD